MFLKFMDNYLNGNAV